MEETLNLCLGYLFALGINEEEAAKAFYTSVPEDELKNNRNKEGKINKVKSKDILSDFRTYCIGLTPELRGKEKSEKSESTGTKGVLLSHAFIEDGISLNQIPEELLKRIEEKTVIKHYKDIFNKSDGNFLSQKRSGDVIIAKNRDALVYPGAPFCQSFGNEHFYYTSCVKNCIYDCEYCFLRGMYPCGYITVFVNLDDYFEEVSKILKEHSVYLSVSYDTDLLALESVLGYVKKWTEFAAGHSNLKIEIRTKSGNTKVFEKLDPGPYNNSIFAWTLSPENVINAYENNTPALDMRLYAAKAAMDKGFPVRLCFDPMIFHRGWRESYSGLYRKAFETLDPGKITDVGVGVFRISNKLLRKLRNVDPCSRISCFPYITEEGASHYGDVSKEMEDFAVSELKKYIPEAKIYRW